MPVILQSRPLGAQLLQATLNGHSNALSIFYLSPLIDSSAPARGGVPVLFPQFADTGPLPKHGFVRGTHWQHAGEAAYTLVILPTDYPFWPFAATLRLTLDSREDGLRLTLTVRNTGEETFHWTGGLHPYFAVDDLLTSRLVGLSGLNVLDRYEPTHVRENARVLSWTESPYECLYAGAPALQLHTGTHTLKLTVSGFTDWMVWNPGREGAVALADLPNDDWRHFVCIEPVCVTQPVEVAPGGVFEGMMDVQVESPRLS